MYWNPLIQQLGHPNDVWNLFKVNKDTERHHGRRSVISIIKFEQIYVHHSYVFIATLNKLMQAK